MSQSETSQSSSSNKSDSVSITLRSKSEEFMSILNIRAPSWLQKGMLIKTSSLSQKCKKQLVFPKWEISSSILIALFYLKHKSRIIKIFYHSSPLWVFPQHLLRYCLRRPLMVQFAPLPIFYVAFAVHGLHRWHSSHLSQVPFLQWQSHLAQNLPIQLVGEKRIECPHKIVV